MSLLELLAIETGASFETLGRIITTAPRRYKVYAIPKRHGGTRTIAHPARELKTIQRVVLRQVLDKVTISEIATAYVSGRGILFNATQHIGQQWILKLDFKDFFHSIVPGDWDRVVRRTESLRSFTRDRELLHKTLFWGGLPKSNIPRYLSVGAPTSPSVSNLACVNLDKWMIEQANKYRLKVTRYADDITVSGSSVDNILKFEAALKNALTKSKGIRLFLNDKKRGLYGPGERRMVTGLIITPDGSVSIGRQRKREISALIHRYWLGLSDEEVVMRTRGLLAFAMSAEPMFFVSMQEKYGSELINGLMKAETMGAASQPDIEF